MGRASTFVSRFKQCGAGGKCGRRCALLQPGTSWQYMGIPMPKALRDRLPSMMSSGLNRQPLTRCKTQVLCCACCNCSWKDTMQQLSASCIKALTITSPTEATTFFCLLWQALPHKWIALGRHVHQVSLTTAAWLHVHAWWDCLHHIKAVLSASSLELFG